MAKEKETTKGAAPPPKDAAPAPDGQNGGAARQRASVHDYLKTQLPEIQRALPKHIDAARFIRVVLTAVSQTPKLMLCSRESLLLSVMRAAQLGLEPDGLLGHAYLVPYFIRGKDGHQGQYVCQLQVGYQGFLVLARNTGLVTSIVARAVYQGDVFEFWFGLDEDHLKHVPAPPDKQGELTHAYCVVRVKDGDPVLTVLDRETIEAQHRARSRSWNKEKPEGPWVTDYDAMCIKTAIRAACKYGPKDVRLARAVALDERGDRGIPIDLGPEEVRLLGETRVEGVGLSTEDLMAAAVEAQNDAPRPAEEPAVKAAEKKAEAKAYDAAAGEVPPDTDFSKPPGAQKRLPHNEAEEAADLFDH